MSAGIPGKFKIDFSALMKADLVAQAWSRMLSQFWASPVMKSFVAALIHAGPEATYRKIVETMEAQTLYMAQGEDLEAIGRIVGQSRIPYQYDDSTWFFFDRPGQGFDQSPWWVEGAPLTSNAPAEDPQYRRMILARIACNFCRFSSVPEMAYLAEFVTGQKVSWRRAGPMEAEIMVSGNISRSSLDVLTKTATTTECDDIYMVPYMATLNLTRIVFLPAKPFIFDRGSGHQFDAGSWAVERDL
jgi:hypothetical protein